MRPRTAIRTWIFGLSTFFVVAVGVALAAQPQENAASQGSLATACEQAKSDFHPLTSTDAAQAKTVLQEAIGRLEERLTEPGVDREGWSRYLHLDLLQQSLAADEKPNLDRLTQVYGFFTKGYDGLELAWFLDVQHALQNYIVTTKAVDNPGLRKAYEATLDRLAPALDAYAAKPTTADALAISESMRWLQNAHQAPSLLEKIQSRFEQPNVIGRVSAELVGAGLVEPIDDVTQVNDCILGTSITGTAHTVGKTSSALAANTDVGVIDAIFFGKTHSENVGTHGPVTIFSTAETSLSGIKRIWINEDGLASYPAASHAETSINICDIQSRKGRGMIERMAWKRAGKQQAQAESIASRHAEQKLNERIDQQATEPLEKANQQYVEKYKQPFGNRSLLPQFLRFSTTDRFLQILGLQAGGGKVGAPNVPPPAMEKTDMTLQLHESAINNLAFDALAGRTIYEEKVQAMTMNLLGKLPKTMQGDKDDKPWAITFASREPVAVSFVDNGFKIRINGVKFYKGADSCDATTVSASYKIEKTPEGFKAVRQGPVEVVAAGEHPNTGATQVATRKLLKRRFEKILEPEIVGKGIELSGRWKAAGTLTPVQVECRDGWLVIAWNRAPAKPKAETKTAKAKAAVTKIAAAK